MERLDKMVSRHDRKKEFGKEIKSVLNKENEPKNSTEFNHLEEVARLKDELEKERQEHEEEVTTLKNTIIRNNIDYQLEKNIMLAKGKNIKAIKALIDTDKLTLDESGRLSGLDLEEIKKSDPYLFEQSTDEMEGTGVFTRISDKNMKGSFVRSARKAAGLIG